MKAGDRGMTYMVTVQDTEGKINDSSGFTGRDQAQATFRIWCRKYGGSGATVTMRELAYEITHSEDVVSYES
jgi:hypothetical protein